MAFQITISYIYLIVACITALFAFTALMIAAIYRKRCFNFPTLLACNTILGVFIYGITHISMCAYMIVWDQQTVPKADALCSVRAYFYHTSVAFIHHSFIIQAIEKYLKIRGVHFFDSPIRKLVLVMPQWIFDFCLILPILLTGNLEKPNMDNLCFIKLSRPDLLFSMGALSFFITDVTVITLYRLLVRFVRLTSAKVATNRKVRMERELTMVRRILMLNGLLVLLGSPVLIFNIIVSVRIDIVPQYTLRCLMLFMNLPMILLVIVICLQTPRLHESCVECYKSITKAVCGARVRIQPSIDTTQTIAHTI